MKVKVQDIPESGLTLREAVDPNAARLQTSDLELTQPLFVVATFHRQRDTVTVQVEASGEMELECSRCLEHFGKGYREAFSFGYSVKDMQVLDMTNDIRQEILLSYPVKLVCKEDCLGLCARCGHNLNQGPCSCGEPHAVT